jgi:hypothetical protein
MSANARDCIGQEAGVARESGARFNAVLVRLTLRCSGPEKHKVHAAGDQHSRAHGRYRARVLGGRWPAAELGS